VISAETLLDDLPTQIPEMSGRVADRVNPALLDEWNHETVDEIKHGLQPLHVFQSLESDVRVGSFEFRC
jgi:hypothetical protein